ncbi:MAG: Fic family protein [Burkholderiales bacterium]|nr:Fic family protein [Burkholderiales bacterium]
MNEKFNLKPLPPLNNFDHPQIWKVLNIASRSLAELKGESKTIPNIDILINTLSLQESKESSEIENIITTQDELFKAQIDDISTNMAAKEVNQYANAIFYGYNLIKQHNLLTSNSIIAVQEILEPSKAGFRKLIGTVLKDSSGKIVYTPPQNSQEIIELMSNLEKYINLPELHDVDPLIKMAIIHHQFESIHPFYDGNGRTGRIINILYLVYMGLLDIPVLYLGRYINKNKIDYYRLLQEVRTSSCWKEWVIWILNGIDETAKQTIKLIREINQLMKKFKLKIQREAKNIYSKELLECLFKHPYTKIKFIENDLGVYRQTASKYLDRLVDLELLTPHKLWKSNYYINHELFNLLSNANLI